MNLLKCFAMQSSCRSPIRRTLRYSNIVKMKLQQIEEVKKRVIGFEKVKRGNDMLKVKKYMEAMVEFRAALSSNPGLLEAHLGQACALCGLHDYDQAIQHLSFIIEHSSYKVLMLEKLPTLRLKSSLSNNNVNSKLADNELAIDALLQWALVCSARNDFATGLAICDIILQKNPDHAKTAEIRVGLENRVKREVIEVITKEVGGRGHWYQCPNGHSTWWENAEDPCRHLNAQIARPQWEESLTVQQKEIVMQTLMAVLILPGATTQVLELEGNIHRTMAKSFYY
jgi:tetratricopeptide (TPR) repeat protein